MAEHIASINMLTMPTGEPGVQFAASPEFFDLGVDPFETTPLPLSGLTTGQLSSYSSLLARATALGF